MYRIRQPLSMLNKKLNLCSFSYPALIEVEFCNQRTKWWKRVAATWHLKQCLQSSESFEERANIWPFWREARRQRGKEAKWRETSSSESILTPKTGLYLCRDEPAPESGFLSRQDADNDACVFLLWWNSYMFGV